MLLRGCVSSLSSFTWRDSTFTHHLSCAGIYKLYCEPHVSYLQESTLTLQLPGCLSCVLYWLEIVISPLCFPADSVQCLGPHSRSLTRARGQINTRTHAHARMHTHWVVVTIPLPSSHCLESFFVFLNSAAPCACVVSCTAPPEKMVEGCGEVLYGIPGISRRFLGFLLSLCILLFCLSLL